MAGMDDFIEATKDRKPNGYLVDAVRMLGARRGDALDIGCGSGVDAKFLGEQGFQVTAFDNNERSIQITTQRTAGLPVTVQKKDIEDFVFDENGYDLIIAWRSLPFVKRDGAERALRDIQKYLRTGGIGVLALFGPEDGWARDRTDMSFFTLDELKELLNPMKFVRVFEERSEGNLATGGTKFFHLINLIVQKTV